MLTHNIYQLLGTLGLSEQRILRMLPYVTRLHFNANEIISPKGSFRQPWSYINSGLMCAGHPGEGDSFTPVSIYGPGAWFGETAILDLRGSALEYICLTPLSVMAIPLEQAKEAFEQEQKFSNFLARLICWRSQQHSEMLVLMKTGNPQLRVVMGLALFAEAQGGSSSHLPGSEKSGRLSIPLKQALLASMFGVSRGVLSACLQQLAVAGWLRLDYATLELLSLNTWGSFSRTYRKNRLNLAKPSMPDLLLSMNEAALV